MQSETYSKRLYKLRFYLHGLRDSFLTEYFRTTRVKKAASYYDLLSQNEKVKIHSRINYYNKIKNHFDADFFPSSVTNYSRKDSWAYHLDFKPLIASFPGHCKFEYKFGDQTVVPDMPTFIKSRPISIDESNANSVILKLNSVRHYFMINDHLSFHDKKPIAVWRGFAKADHRQRFIEQCHNIPGCDIGDISKRAIDKPWHRKFMTIREQLNNRFVISVEGNDVATNLKWIMASNSLCMMVKPRFETWFMEGRLIPGIHYVQILDDYSDLEEKIDYFNKHPEEAQTITRNANNYVQQFCNDKHEFIISLLVMQKYFSMSSQLHETYDQATQHLTSRLRASHGYL